MKDTSYENILNLLAHIQKRPLMYVSSDVPAVVMFLDGFRMACTLLNPHLPYDILLAQVMIERGWQNSAQSFWSQMQERGYDDEAITAEGLAIHITIWERLSETSVVNEHQALEEN